MNTETTNTTASEEKLIRAVSLMCAATSEIAELEKSAKSNLKDKGRLAAIDTFARKFAQEKGIALGPGWTTTEVVKTIARTRILAPAFEEKPIDVSGWSSNASTPPKSRLKLKTTVR